MASSSQSQIIEILRGITVRVVGTSCSSEPGRELKKNNDDKRLDKKSSSRISQRILKEIGDIGQCHLNWILINDHLLVKFT